MRIEFYPTELNYTAATIHPLAPRPPRFLFLFCLAAGRADEDDYEVMRPAIQVWMKKYPPDADIAKIVEFEADKHA